MARIIGEIRPSYAYIENSPALVTRGLDRVLSDLARLGFDAQWGVMGAADVGAPHQRDRIWILATNNKSVDVQKPALVEKKETHGESGRTTVHLSRNFRGSGWSGDKPPMAGVVDGLAHWANTSKAIGDGQVPRVAATAFNLLSKQP
jgi:DNA (cytosine-5)-methyltransferase 1